jgi:predicted phosphodiesterase
MRVAALYDIHANAPALRAVLDDVARADADLVVVGGDVVSGPLPKQTLELLCGLELPVRFVRGNADREVLAARDEGRLELEAAEDPLQRAAVFAAASLSRAQRDLLAAFEPRVVLDLEGLGPTLFCHGSPRSDEEILTTETPDERLREIVAGVREPLVVCGHTHRSFDRRLGRRRIVNAGSVGCPYEGVPGAYWALLAPGAVGLRRTEYDIAAALEELRAGGFPDTDEMLRESLLEPMDPDEVARFFEAQAHSGR